MWMMFGQRWQYRDSSAINIITTIIIEVAFHVSKYVFGQFSQSRNRLCIQCRKNVSSDASRAFCVFRQNVEAIVWVSLGHSSLDSTGEHGLPKSSKTSVLLFRASLYCSGCIISPSPLNCPLGSLHPSGTVGSELKAAAPAPCWPVADPHSFFYQS